MQVPETSACRKSDSESENIMSFDKSFQEFRDLRSQLHYAADYCEATFLNAEHGFKAVDLPLFLSKYSQKPSFALPVLDGLSVLSKDPNPTFHFQQISQKHGRYRLFRQSANSSNDVLSLIRRIKRTT